MSDETPYEPPIREDGTRDYSNYPTPSTPADDPIFREGVIFTFPIRPTRLKTDEGETKEDA